MFDDKVKGIDVRVSGANLGKRPATVNGEDSSEDGDNESDAGGRLSNLKENNKDDDVLFKEYTDEILIRGIHEKVAAGKWIQWKIRTKRRRCRIGGQ